MNKGDNINLNDWFYDNKSDVDIRNLFINMSKAQKKLNDSGYGIRSFNFNDIYLEDRSPTNVRFGALGKLSTDILERRSEVSREIYILVLMQIGVYTGCLNSINRNSVRENFDLFLPFLPEMDVPYYRNIIDSQSSDRANCVYFCDYVEELDRRKRNSSSQSLDEGNSMSGNKVLSKNNGNKRIEVYEEGHKTAAYINFVVIPIGIVIAGIVLTIISWFIK